MRYKVEIETRPDRFAPGRFEASAVRCPSWAKGVANAGAFTAPTREYLFDTMRERLQRRYPQHSFDFIHTSA